MLKKLEKNNKNSVLPAKQGNRQFHKEEKECSGLKGLNQPENIRVFSRTI